MEILKVEVSIPGPMLAQSFEHFGTLATDGWLKHTWKFLWDHGFQIEDDIVNLMLQCNQDAFLNVEFERQGFQGG